MGGALSIMTATPLFFFACAKKRVVFLLAIPYADGFGHRSQVLKGREILRTEACA